MCRQRDLTVKFLTFPGEGDGPHVHISQHDPGWTLHKAASCRTTAPQRGPPAGAQCRRDPPWPGTPGSTHRLACSGHTEDTVKIKTLCSIRRLPGWLSGRGEDHGLEEWDTGKHQQQETNPPGRVWRLAPHGMDKEQLLRTRTWLDDLRQSHGGIRRFSGGRNTG